MSAFYSNQPERQDSRVSGESRIRESSPSQVQPNDTQPADGDRIVDDSADDSVDQRIVDAETSMSFPSTDESGEPIELNSPRCEDDPTPEEIEQRSEEIRQRWSDRVKKKRHLRAPVKWNVPSVPVADIDFPGS